MKINKFLAILIVAMALSSFGSLALNQVFAAKISADSIKKYDYTKSLLGDINGKNGKIEYEDDLKKLLDDGWRIMIADGGWLILEKERQN